MYEMGARVTAQQGTVPRATASRLRRHALTRPRRPLTLWVRLLPILFLFAYLNLTVFLFAYGPWPWPVSNARKLYTFLISAHVALLLGYLSKALARPGGYFFRWKPRHLVTCSLILNLLLLVPTSVARSGSVIPDLVWGITNPGPAYYASNSLRAESSSLAEYVRILLGPVLFLQFPLTVYYWTRLRWEIRLFSVLSIAYFLAVYVATGTNKAIADYVLVAPFLVAASYFAGLWRLNWRRTVFVIALALTALWLLLSFFTAGQVSRLGGTENIAYFHFLRLYANTRNPLVHGLPEQAKAGAIALVKYVSHGYYGLSLSLEEPFVPMWGLGNSRFLYLNAAELTGIDKLQELPYPVRVQKHGKWDAYEHWSSIYPWIASDVSFPGAILAVFVIGRLFAQSWLDSVRGANPFAIAALAQLVIMLLYFPANNQVVQSGEALTSFYGILAAWLLSRRRYVWGKCTN